MPVSAVLSHRGVLSSCRALVGRPASIMSQRWGSTRSIRSTSTQLPFKKQLQNKSLLKTKALVGGKWIEAVDGRRFDIIDPGTSRVWASAPLLTGTETKTAIEAASRAFEKYKTVNPRERANRLLEWHGLIKQSRHDLANVVVHETGKPYAEAIGEIDYALGFTWWFAGEAERIRGSVAVPAVNGRRVMTVKQPIGVTAALVPWNFPIAMILRKASAALAAGCTMVIKPSPETPLSTLILADLARQAGFEDGVLNVVTTDLENTPAVSEVLCTHPDVKKVTFTGSTAVGKLIAKMCSSTVKKVTLELGGNCPVVVFEDADLDQACGAIAALKWRNAGQACVAANRIYVHKNVYDDVLARLVKQTAKLKVGHGAVQGTTIGAMTTARGKKKVVDLINDAESKGAKVYRTVDQDGPDLKHGFFVAPTVLTNTTDQMEITKEEVFGPVLPLHAFESEEEAIKLANETSLGLAAYAFTKDADRVWRLSERLEAGMIGINTGNMSAAESPFGGIKESGYGKEAGLGVAVEEYLVTKTVTVTVDRL